MSAAAPYITLISSLPRHDVLFAEQQTPLSRIKLNQRLTMLSEHHRQQLTLVEQVLHWDTWPAAMPHAQVVQRIRAHLQQIEAADVRELIHEKLDLRTVIGALRYRLRQTQQASSQPPSGDWAVSRYRDVIVRHWHEEDFHLSQAFPWLLEALALMRQQQTLQLEQLIMRQAWQTLNRHMPEDEFSFMAVVQYVMKWHLIERWNRRDGAVAQQRFTQLIRSALKTVGSTAHEHE
ncbi:hypothetical protein CHH28_00730 [Bacterioplanes sanyensis]|uniref:DUF2764 domain-containing protein n=1 Tax=Bacterioplanes sanyensis TaxID=1249553 RepID=A0A222FDX7_9GAMM|nr:DUF2764 family protein [Bacterioplanes sanyensis]ASP37295.1 hypothetical protein CHH28_00730 [Bacterioplanes sanyensis]